MEEASSLELVLIHKTAEEYRQKGYEVTVETPLDFLPGFFADLVARKGEEVKVIEVKSRASLAASPQIGELARILDSKLGWSLDLVMVGEPERLDSPSGASAYDREDIAGRVEEAEELLRLEYSGAAFLAAWAACEAAARLLVSEEGITTAGITTSGYVLEQATHLGVISREEYRRLNEWQKYRNALIHGYGNSDFDSGLVIALIKMVREMIGAN